MKRKRLTGATLADAKPKAAEAGDARFTNEWNPVFKKYLDETGSLYETMKLMDKWYEEHGMPEGEICTNNKYELELERKYVEWKCKEYGIEPPSEEELK